jgi:hypothetical protein
VRRLPVIAIVVAFAAAFAPTPALAHEISVLAPGSASIDAGDGSTARLIHATLLDPGDTLRVTVHAGAAGVDTMLLVPNAGPEQLASRHALPDMPADELVPITDETPTDDSTHIEYRALVEASIASTTRTIVVSRGSVPTRVALLVRPSSDTRFRADHPSRTPKTLLRLQQWAATPAAAARNHDAGSASHATFRAWYAAALAVIALLVAAWWVRTGKRRSRERGVERARGE